MGAVDVGVGHDDDLVVARLRDVEIPAVAGARGHAGADGGDERLDGVARERAVVAHALDVQDLAAQRKDRLDVTPAAVLGRAACGVALHDEELGHLGVAHGAVGELSGQRRALEQALAARGLAGLLGGEAALGGLGGLLQDLLRLVGVLLEVVGHALGNHAVHERAHVGAAELGLGLTLELRVGELDRDDRGEALADVAALEVGVLLLDDVLFAAVVVYHLGEGRAEALEVHAALLGVDVVGKGEGALGVAGVPLQGHLDLAHLALGGVGRGGAALDVDRAGEPGQDVLLVVQELDEVDDAAGVAELLGARRELALVDQHDLEVLVEKRRLLQVVVERVPAVGGGLEDLVVRPEGDGGARGLGGANLAHLLHRLAALEDHLVDLAVALHLGDEPLGEGVDDRDAHAVQAAGDLVGVVVELAAGVQDGEDDLEGRDLLDRVLLHRNAAAVVVHGDGVVRVDGHLDLGAEARHGLVHRVVHDLPHQVVQAGLGRRADVHAGALADGLEALQDLDLPGSVLVLALLCHAHILPRRAAPRPCARCWRFFSRPRSK